MCPAMTTSIYFACFHSDGRNDLDDCTGQFRIVEEAICRGEWPYDNGDDPSFYVARNQEQPLTWGVCRQDLRNSIKEGSVVVFFSFTNASKTEVNYRICAVATVKKLVDHRAPFRDPALRGGKYLNTLIRPNASDWEYYEGDRPERARHEDWFWRMADHAGMKQPAFNRQYSKVHATGKLSEAAIERGEIPLGQNYIVFSKDKSDFFISPNPPDVATARKGAHEVWSDSKMKALTVDLAAKYHSEGRDYLRLANKTNRNVHRHIRVEVRSEEVAAWREKLIAAIRKSENKIARPRTMAAGAGPRC
jgi:hypothetical protein